MSLPARKEVCPGWQKQMSELHQGLPAPLTQLILLREKIRAYSSPPDRRACYRFRCQLPSRRPPRKLANGRPLKRRTPAKGTGASRCPDPGLCRAHGTLARDLRCPHLDRRQGAWPVPL